MLGFLIIPHISENASFGKAELPFQDACLFLTGPYRDEDRSNLPPEDTELDLFIKKEKTVAPLHVSKGL